MEFRCNMFPERWEESLEEIEEDLLPDHIMTDDKAQAVEQEEDEGEEGNQREECEGGSQTGTPMAQK
jgi:hypothetical protein